jgi:hypothetical protein
LTGALLGVPNKTSALTGASLFSNPNQKSGASLFSNPNQKSGASLSSNLNQKSGASLSNPNKKARKYQAIEFEDDEE